MASPQASVKLLASAKIVALDFDPADPTLTTYANVTWYDMSNFGLLTVLLFHSVGTTKVVAFEIVGATSAAGANPTVVKAHASQNATGFIDAVGDYALLECTAQELAQEGEDAGFGPFRYVGVNIVLGNSGDEAVPTLIFSMPRFAYSGLSADHQA